jgi:hypothetical protein
MPPLTKEGRWAIIAAWQDYGSVAMFEGQQVLRDWPPNSPDLNPIEHVWAYVQARVNVLGCYFFDELSRQCWMT